MSNWHTVFGQYEGSGWITPQGIWYPTAFGKHDEFAIPYVAKNYPKVPLDDANDFLLEQGWIIVSKSGNEIGITVFTLEKGVKNNLIEYLSASDPYLYVTVSQGHPVLILFSGRPNQILSELQ